MKAKTHRDTICNGHLEAKLTYIENVNLELSYAANVEKNKRKRKQKNIPFPPSSSLRQTTTSFVPVK